MNIMWLTVRRTGDLSLAATVDYTTSNGTAHEGYDYTLARGTLRFAPGETTKQIYVLITDDNYAESDETLALTLSNPTGGARLNSDSSTTVIIVDNDATATPENPADQAGFFTRQHYADFLNREPDSSGLAFWTNEIESCGANVQCREVKRINVSAAFFLSIEFQQTGFLVYRFYNAALTRPESLPRYLEFSSDTQEISRGVVVGAIGWEQQLERNKLEFAERFVKRAEFVALYPETLAPAEYVDALYAHAGLKPDATERNAAIAEFDGGAGARARVLRRVAENETLKARELNRAFVLAQYFGYLRRSPNEGPDTNFDGYHFWLSKLNDFGGNFVKAEMVKAFINSDEYRKRFGQQ